MQTTLTPAQKELISESLQNTAAALQHDAASLMDWSMDKTKPTRDEARELCNQLTCRALHARDLARGIAAATAVTVEGGGD